MRNDDSTKFERADQNALAAFDPRTKICVMNCGPTVGDPRSPEERRFLCQDCMTVCAAIRSQPVPVEPRICTRGCTVNCGSCGYPPGYGDSPPIEPDNDKYEDSEQGDAAYHRDLHKYIDSLKLQLQVAQRQRDDCYASLEVARSRLHEIAAFVSGATSRGQHR